jgi:uncharacterized protein YjbI with pentapeptide repeats
VEIILLVSVLPTHLIEEEIVVDEIVDPLQKAPAYEEKSGADLTRADLRAIDLTGSNLANADLTEANLSGAFLLNANLSGAKLTGADLTGAELTGANLAHVDLSQTVLNGVEGLAFNET